MSILLKNGKFVFQGNLVEAGILLEDGRIKKISKSAIKGDKSVDCRGKIILPGLIDTHVHFRYPGGEQKETWGCASRAALAGGVTTVLDMPNTSPATTTRGLLGEKREHVSRHSLVNYGFQFGAAVDNAEEMEKARGIASLKVFMGSSTGSLLVDDEAVLKRIFEIAKARMIPAVVHAEDEAIIRRASEEAKKAGLDSSTAHNRARLPQAELVAVERALAIQRRVGNKLHFLHISTAAALAKILEAKKGSSAVSAEATPHHLLLTEAETKRLGNFAKMNPPLRSANDRDAIWKGFAGGIIDVVGTDHAPHTREEKERSYWEAPSGVPGVETMLPLLLNEVNSGRLGLGRVAEACCAAPARVFGMRGKGAIAEGMDADLAVVDMKRKIEIKGELLYTKCGWSMFEGRKLQGAVEMAFVNGEIAYENREFHENHNAREVSFCG